MIVTGTSKVTKLDNVMYTQNIMQCVSGNKILMLVLVHENHPAFSFYRTEDGRCHP